MEERDTLILSRDFESTSKYTGHKPKDSLDSDLGRLSEAIFRKQYELENGRPRESNALILNDEDEFLNDEQQFLANERLQMKFEDCLSLLTFRIYAQSEQDFMIFSRMDSPYYNFVPQRKSLFEVSNSADGTVSNYVECSLGDLYQLQDDVSKIITYVENDIKKTGRLTLGNMKLDIKVVYNDAHFPEKSDISEGFSSCNDISAVGSNISIQALTDFFCQTEEQMIKAFESFEFFPSKAIKKYDNLQKDPNRSAVIMFLEYSILKNFKSGENVRMQELEWQASQAKNKKSYFFNKSKKMNMREEELRRLNKNVSQQTVKNAKDREMIEEEMREFQKSQDDYLASINQKVEYIRQVLQEIEDTKFEVREDVMINKSINKKLYEAPSITEEVPIDLQIKELENELERLEHKYKTSKVPETLESISTSINHIKSTLLNFQSLKAMKKTERASSALRNVMKTMERSMETSMDYNSSSKTGSSGNNDQAHKSNKLPIGPVRVNNIPSSPAPNRTNRFALSPAPNHKALPTSNSSYIKANNVIISPLRKLEVSTRGPDMSLLNSPSKKNSPFLGKSDIKEELELKKFLRIKEEQLRDREDELVIEENRLQTFWMNIPEGREIIPAVQKLMGEYRGLRLEVGKKQDLLEREKYEWREKSRCLERKEQELKDAEKQLKDLEKEFEIKKDKILEKLEWLKRKLVQQDF